jgi:hypothetical protein
MKKNMGSLDRFIRSFIAVNILLFYYKGFISGPVAVVLVILAIIFIVTSLFAYCPLYTWLGIHTNKSQKQLK